MLKRKRVDQGLTTVKSLLKSAHIKNRILLTSATNEEDATFIADALSILKENGSLTTTNCQALASVKPIYQIRVAMGIVTLKKNNLLYPSNRKEITHQYGDDIAVELVRLNGAHLLSTCRKLISKYPHYATLQSAKLIILLAEAKFANYIELADTLFANSSAHQLIDLIDALSELSIANCLTNEAAKFLLTYHPNTQDCLITLSKVIVLLANNHLIDTDNRQIVFNIIKLVPLRHAWELCDMMVRLAKINCFNDEGKQALAIACKSSIEKYGISYVRCHFVDCLVHDFFTHLENDKHKLLLVGLALALPGDCTRILRFLEKAQRKNILTDLIFIDIVSLSYSEASGEQDTAGKIEKILQLPLYKIHSPLALIEAINHIKLSIQTTTVEPRVIANNYNTLGLFGSPSQPQQPTTPQQQVEPQFCAII